MKTEVTTNNSLSDIPMIFHLYENYEIYDVLLLRCKKSFSFCRLEFNKDLNYILSSYRIGSSKEMIYYFYDPYFQKTDFGYDLKYWFVSFVPPIEFFNNFQCLEKLTNLRSIFEENELMNYKIYKYKNFDEALYQVARQESPCNKMLSEILSK